MKFTRHTDYALRVLMHLAAEPERLMSISEIAQAQRVSKNHLMKVVHALSLAGFVATVRGRGGGLRLARPAAEIRVGEVVRSTEGDCALVDCTGCALAAGCRLTGVLKRAQAALYAALDEHTIGDLQPRLIDRKTATGPPRLGCRHNVRETPMVRVEGKAPQRIAGCVIGLAGLAILAALGVAIYDHAASRVLVDLGIPGAMLAALAGLALVCVGAAVALSRDRGRP